MARIVGQAWRALSPEKQNEYRMMSIFMRDNPIPGVPMNTYDGIQVYRRAMGLPETEMVLPVIPTVTEMVPEAVPLMPLMAEQDEILPGGGHDITEELLMRY